jgi:hypothetical protein
MVGTPGGGFVAIGAEVSAEIGSCSYTGTRSKLRPLGTLVGTQATDAGPAWSSSSCRCGRLQGATWFPDRGLDEWLVLHGAGQLSVRGHRDARSQRRPERGRSRLRRSQWLLRERCLVLRRGTCLEGIF